MKYENMTDRELDAAVAEKVMGWEVEPGNNYWHTLGKDEWHPSTSIADAWEVVEKMKCDAIRLYVSITDVGEDGFRVNFSPNFAYATDWTCVHKNVCRAIDIAALKAVEVVK